LHNPLKISGIFCYNNKMDPINTLLPLGACIMIGALIGLEREKTKQLTKGVSAIGIRTDILICLFGGVASFLGQNINPIIFIICLAAMLILTISSYIYLSIRRGRIGITTEISTILVFLYGAMAMAGYTQLAVVMAIITMVILSVRTVLHKAVYHINNRELFDTIKFAIIAFIVLPFLPNVSYDKAIFNFLFPGVQPPAAFNQINVINPNQIWFLVVLVSGISFLGYILVKLIGKKRGIGFSGLLGGLYSSTATSLALSHKSKEMPKAKAPILAGIILACAISFLRTFIEIRALNAELFSRTLIPVTMMFAYMLIIGLYYMFSHKDEPLEHHSDKLQTPFNLKRAIILGAYIVGALIMAKIALSYADINLYYIISSALAFFAIDDPVVISTSASAGTLMSYEHAKNIVIIVVYLNMVQKTALMYFFGNRKLVKPLAIIFGGLLLVSLAGLVYF
jgi:uncharacterized membrane protein (DUF4010 family)